MTYEQKKRLDHYAMCLTMFALAVVLVIAVACLVVCLYDPTMGRFCFNLIVASVVISFTVWFLCLAFCEIISWCLFNGIHNQGGMINRLFFYNRFSLNSSAEFSILSEPHIFIFGFPPILAQLFIFSVFIPFSSLPRFSFQNIRRF